MALHTEAGLCFSDPPESQPGVKTRRSSFMVQRTKKEQAHLECDVLVVGGGGSGLAAACAAAQMGAKTIVLEKRHATGGDTALAGGLFAAGSSALKRLRNDSNPDDLIKRSLSYAHWKVDPRIVRAFIYKSGDTIQWLEDLGVKFFEISQYIPAQGPRIMHMPEGMGLGLVKILAKQCRDLGVTILTKTAVRKIVVNRNGRITGVVAIQEDKEQKISVKAVVIAAGGYAGNRSLLNKYYPYYTEDLHAVGLPLMGDGLQLAMEAGAATDGLGTLLLRGPYFRGPIDVVTVAMEPNTIWVNSKGVRFVDEAIGFNWPESANALNRQPGRISYTLFDNAIKRGYMEQGLIKGYSNNPPLTKLTKLDQLLHKESGKGEVKIADSVDEIEAWMGSVPKGVLSETVARYNRACEKGYDDLLLKDHTYLQPLCEPPYVAIKCHQGFLGTLGGIKINEHMEVLNDAEGTIAGLFAAGAGTGGWESDTYCLELSGSAFSFAINSGRIAGENAVKYITGNTVKRITS
jgi:fumarate reductase flavoprotein subunit